MPIISVEVITFKLELEHESIETFNFEKYGLVQHMVPKHKNLGQKRKMAKKQLENRVSDFP